MDGHAVSDPTDWLETSLASFSPLETALRCQVCKDFFNTPMITSCSHTFCSLCIRRCLSAEGRCPACRASDQASKLRRNWTVEEVVATFQAARSDALNLATDHKKRKLEQEEGSPPVKRRRVVKNGTGPANGSHRQTRSQARGSQEQAPQADVMVIDDDHVDGDYAEEPEPDDGLVSCPMCGDRMREASVFGHLDKCDGTPPSKKKQNNTNSIPKPPLRPPAQQQERLPELNYSILTDGAMRKKLKELGIPSTGPKTLLVRRHTEWVNLWNSNCDSVAPKTKRELLHELDVWERSQGGLARESHGSLNGIMKKEFDSQAYATSNKDDFSRLIEEARRKAKKPAQVEAIGNEPPSEGQSAERPSDGDMPAGIAAQRTAASPPEVRSADNDNKQSHLLEPPSIFTGKRSPSIPNGHNASPADESSRPTNDAPPPTTDDPHYSGQGGIPPPASLRKETSDELGERFSMSTARKVPMFAVPADPVSDIEQEQVH